MAEQSHVGFFDGGCAPNPGVSGSGWVLYNPKGKILNAGTVFRDHGSNNEAEYLGMIGLLNEARERDIDDLVVFGDSDLVIKHMTGVYQCRAENLKPLFEEAKALTTSNTIFKHVTRNNNKVADKLCHVARQSKKSEIGLHLL